VRCVHRATPTETRWREISKDRSAGRTSCARYPRSGVPSPNSRPGMARLRWCRQWVHCTPVILSLVRMAQRRADRVIVSIFVNPTQFAPHEDLETYPRTFAADLSALASLKADVVWAPDAKTMYPQGFATRWCRRERPWRALKTPSGRISSPASRPWSPSSDPV